MRELADLIEEFSDEVFDEDFGRIDFEKKDIPEKVKEAFRENLKILLKYKSDFPEDLEDSISNLLKFVAVSYGYGQPGKSPGKKVKKQVRFWPSFDFDGEGKEEIERIKKRRSGGGDKFPSITAQLFGTGEPGEEDEED